MTQAFNGVGTSCRPVALAISKWARRVRYCRPAHVITSKGGRGETLAERRVPVMEFDPYGIFGKKMFRAFLLADRRVSVPPLVRVPVQFVPGLGMSVFM